MRWNDITSANIVEVNFTVLKEAVGKVGERTVNMRALQKAWEQSGKPTDLMSIWKVLKKAGLSDTYIQRAFRDIGVPTEEISVGGNKAIPGSWNARQGEASEGEPITGGWYARRKREAAARSEVSPRVDEIAQFVQAHPSVYEEVRKMLGQAFQQLEQQRQRKLRGG